MMPSDGVVRLGSGLVPTKNWDEVVNKVTSFTQKQTERKLSLKGYNLLPDCHALSQLLLDQVGKSHLNSCRRGEFQWSGGQCIASIF